MIWEKQLPDMKAVLAPPAQPNEECEGARSGGQSGRLQIEAHQRQVQWDAVGGRSDRMIDLQPRRRVKDRDPAVHMATQLSRQRRRVIDARRREQLFGWRRTAAHRAVCREVLFPLRRSLTAAFAS